MSLFALGLGVPFFLSAVLTSYAMGIMNKMKQHFRVIEIVSGLLLIIVGLAIAFGNLGDITAIFSNLLENN